MPATKAAPERLALSARWYPLRNVGAQMGYVFSRHRFNVVPAGRRGGKTERAKRKLVMRAMRAFALAHGRRGQFFAAAPTRAQAKRIFWRDLKELTAGYWIDKPMESELTIRLRYADIIVLGLDAPERIEGAPWDGGLLDEYANMRPGVWQENVRPALSDRLGWCDLIGVPEGRNHYYDRYRDALAAMQRLGSRSEWGAFTWFSSDVLPRHEIEAARADLDPLVFEQEYEASFVNFAGRAYYAFTDENVAAVRELYDPTQPLIICHDFNVAPGVAAICQHVRVPGLKDPVSAVIGEVWIPNNSNTPAVCRRVVQDWGQHQGLIEVYGDATGGARGTAKVAGSDWDLVRNAYRAQWGGRVAFYVPPDNPSERARVNAVNSRLRSSLGVRRLLVDGTHAAHVVKDFEGVRTLEGGSGEIDKAHDRQLTHISDAVGYYLVYRFPVRPQGASYVSVSA